MTILSKLPKKDRLSYELAAEMGQAVRARELVWEWYLRNQDSLPTRRR